VYSIIKEGRRRRYIGFKINSPAKNFRIKKDEIINEINIQCKTLYNKNCRDLGIFVVRFDKDKGIVRCNHIEKDNTIKLLTSIDNISSVKVNIETLGTSGTIKSLIRKHMQ
jgi:RNase P/RNase MRP subunit POP5